MEKAIEKRPKDKIYRQHRDKVDQTIRERITKEVTFIQKLVDKAMGELALKRRLKHIRRLKKKEEVAGEEEEEKGMDGSEEEEEEEDEEFEEEDLPYPEECRVLDIMRDKYHEAVRFFTDTNDKK